MLVERSHVRCLGEPVRARSKGPAVVFNLTEDSSPAVFHRFAQCMREGSEPKRALAPFHRICTPMHTRRNDVS
jgi:hypothetical protein